MKPSRIAYIIIAVLLIFISLPSAVLSGPPFKTDDPDTVEYKHWEVYVASQYNHARNQDSATLPHIEVNYGLVSNLTVHLLAPMQYVKNGGQPSQYDYGDTEVGIQYRFIE